MPKRPRALALVVSLALVAIIQPFQGPAVAQEGSEAYTSYQLNMRAGPGVEFGVVATLAPDVGLVLEGRSADMSWLLGHTVDGASRGWVASLYLSFSEGFYAGRLPVSGEVLPYQAPAAPAPAASGDAPVGIPAAPNAEGLPTGGLAPQLEALPMVPAISANARAIFQRGQALGNNPQVVTKVGECNSMSWAFLAPFSDGNYELVQLGVKTSRV